MTPTEVWEGFNPVKEPLETSIISSEEKDNLAVTNLFFTSETTSGGRVRVFCHIVYDSRWTDNRAALLITPALAGEMDYETLTETLVNEGYVVCIFDYCGKFKSNVNKTTFPEELSYASYPECVSRMTSIDTDARSTPWFQWVKIARRAVSMLQEHRLVAKDRIGIVGFGAGAQIAWQTAGIDGRLRALVPVNGGGYLWCADRPRFSGSNIPSTDAERAFSTGVGAETYAKFVTCPTCFMICSNSSYFNVDRAGDILSLVPAQSKRLIISPGTDNQITKTAFDALLIWLRRNFAISNAEKLESPKLVFENVGGELYLRLKTSATAKKSVRVCYGESDPAVRYWVKLEDGQKVGEHEYTYRVPYTDPKELVIAYANVVYRDNAAESAPVVYATPAELGITTVIERADISLRLIYNGAMGAGAFTVSTNDVCLDESVLTVSDGPFGIKGISASKGTLSLFFAKNDVGAIASASALRFDAFCRESRNITVRLLAYPSTKYYSAQIRLTGGDFWQKALLSVSDFKSEEGKSLQKFTECKKLSFADAEGVIFNNLLWI